VPGDHITVADFGTGDTTTMVGNDQIGQFYGTDGTIVSTGQGDYLDLTGTQAVTVTGKDTGINNMGVGMDITLAAAGDRMSMNGSNDTTIVTGDTITVEDHGGSDTTRLLGNDDSADLDGSNGTVINYLILGSSSQSVTVSGAERASTTCTAAR
jgi:hypothetical protein